MMRAIFRFLLLGFLMSACANAPAQDLGASLATAAPAAGVATDAAQTDAAQTAVAQTPAIQVPRRPGRMITEAAPAHLMVIGDSLSQGFADALRARAAERGLALRVTNRGRVSTGLARVDYYDWPTNFVTLAAAEKPDIVVGHFGANDMQGVTRPGNRASYGSEGWAAAYRAEARRILATAAENGAVMMWLGPAPDGNAALGRHMKMIPPLFQAEAEAAGALYLPLAAFTSGPEGQYVTAVELGGQMTTIRTGDGSHFNGTGYRLVADRILDALVSRYPDLQPAKADTLAAALQ
ncbi:DUF459 domain-containing protein [Pseudogemmobacter sonorensis]|uniref:DUF459 domain-containing protein n=1 Tax=Pseudogemmobacter sonorensis TaxID=2989681 RepID=UPI0036B67EBD